MKSARGDIVPLISRILEAVGRNHQHLRFAEADNEPLICFMRQIFIEILLCNPEVVGHSSLLPSVLILAS
jgi:hypothetical protein